MKDWNVLKDREIINLIIRIYNRKKHYEFIF